MYKLIDNFTYRILSNEKKGFHAFFIDYKYEKQINTNKEQIENFQTLSENLNQKPNIIKVLELITIEQLISSVK